MTLLTQVAKLVKTARSDILGGGQKSAIVRSAGITAGLQVASTMISFGSSLLYARVLGPHGYGLYAYVIAWTTVLAIPVSLGIPNYLIREGAGRPGSVGTLLRWADQRVAAVGLLMSILLAAVWFIPAAGNLRFLFLLAAPIPFLTALGQVRQSLMRALHRIAASQWPLLIGPSILLCTMYVVWKWRGALHPWEVIAAALAATILIAIIGDVQVRRITHGKQPDSVTGLRIKTALPFMVLGALFLLNSKVDIILLGSIKGPSDAGVYAVVSRGAAFVTFLAAAANLALAPRIADLYRSSDQVLLQRLLTASARRVLLVSTPFVFILLIGSGQILHFFYGTHYTDGSTALRILTIGHFSTVISGATSVIVNMTGQEQKTLYSVCISLFVNIVLNIVLIPYFGINGCALATAISTILFNGIQWYWTRTYLSLRPSAFGI